MLCNQHFHTIHSSKVIRTTHAATVRDCGVWDREVRCVGDDMCITKGVPALQIMCIVYCICKMTNVKKVAIARARLVGHDRDRNDRARVVCAVLAGVWALSV